MSGQTVTGNALQFTNDNKRAYAYSGLINVPTTETNLLLFTTQSETHVAKFQVSPVETHDEDVVFKFYLNNTQVQSIHIFDNKVAGSPLSLHNYILLIIPPFTTVKVTGTMSANAYDQVVTMTSKVSMAPRVGNLDE